jgi:hypothetical protein
VIPHQEETCLQFHIQVSKITAAKCASIYGNVAPVELHFH